MTSFPEEGSTIAAEIRHDPTDGRPPGLWSREVDIPGWVRGHKVGLAIAAGVVFRVAQYLANRIYWLDEASLTSNVRRLTPAGFFGPLSNTQLAPPGFLIAEWLAFRAFGDRPMAYRLVPLLGGVASLYLIRAVARIVLPERSVWLAVALLAAANDPIYFSSEAKQYSTDLAAALACTLLALTLGKAPLNGRSAAILAASGAAVVWSSHPSIFVLAAAGLVGMGSAIGARDGRSVGLWVGVGLAWVASFAGVHAVAMEQLGHGRGMWDFWKFAFPPIPPRSLWDATWPLRRAAFLLLNPLNFDAPFGPRLSMLPALGLALLGARHFWRTDRGLFALLTLPGVFAFLASCLRLYPFHGRLLLFLAPAILLAIAAGLDRVCERLGTGWTYRGLIAMVLLAPAVAACGYLIEPRDRDFHNPVGDNRPESLNPVRFPF